MSDNTKPGTISWIDLTVKNAEKIRDFYKNVADWEHTDVNMGDYNDYCMLPAKEDSPIAGICHKRGSNEQLPSQWLIYINVKNVDESVEKCISLGGKVLEKPKMMGGYGKFCVIQDPEGAVCALFEPAE